MRNARQRIRRFLADDAAPTAAEYAVMLALIAIVIIGAVALLGQTLSTNMNNAAESFNQ